MERDMMGFICVGKREKINYNSFRYVLVGHNTIRGAAGASILNAELINKQIL